MELVYLWVEKYKNIKKQGFNFSPRFTCDYDRAKNKLTIDENKEYVSIFPENINVTAIVGENGSGKSSIIEEIFNEEKKSCKKSDNNYKKKRLYIADKNKQPEKIKFEEFLKIYDILIYSEHINSVLYKSKYHFNNYLNEELDLKEEDQKVNIPISYTGKYSMLEKLDEFKFLPNHFELYLNSRLCKKNLDCIFRALVSKEFGENKYEFSSEEISKFYTLIQDHLNNLVSVFKNNRTKENLKRYLYFREFIYLFSTHQNEKSWILYKKYLENANIPKLESNIEYKLLNNESKKILESFLSIIDVQEDKNGKVILINLKEYDYTDLLKNLYRGYFDIRFLNIKDENKIYFDNLSSGEQELLKFFSKLFYIIKNITFKNDFFIFIDELESSFHPNWQKALIKYLIVFIENLKVENNFHFIITTHSPFILSDLPKENVIFLEKNENGNCKNVSNSIEIEQTFGANIHTLLSHGFFMKDGLMGEFAKDKINEVYNYLIDSNSKSELTQEKAQNIINLIGEPILKKELQDLYDKKFEINNIDKKIREYQEEIKKLEAQRDTNDKA